MFGSRTVRATSAQAVTAMTMAMQPLKSELGDMYPLIEVPDLLMEVHAWELSQTRQ
jgi:hypothetical protein